MKLRRVIPTLSLAVGLGGLGALACHAPANWSGSAGALWNSLLALPAAHAGENAPITNEAVAPAPIQNPFATATVDEVPVASAPADAPQTLERSTGAPTLEPIQPRRVNPPQADDGEMAGFEQPPTITSPTEPFSEPLPDAPAKPHKLPVKDRYARSSEGNSPRYVESHQVVPAGHHDPIVAPPTAADAPPGIADPADATEAPEPGFVTPRARPTVVAVTNEVTADDHEPTSSAHVTLHWTTPSTVALGQEVAAQLAVRNTGPGTAKSVQVEVQLPDGVDANSAEPAPAVEDRALVWRLGDLSPGASTTIQLGFTPRNQGEQCPRAAVTFTQHAAASIRIVQPKLAMAIEGPQQAIAGQPTTYQVRVSNKGTGPAVGVAVDVQLSEGLSAASGVKPRYNVGTLGAGESRHVQITVFGAQPGEFGMRCQAVVDEQMMDEVTHKLHVVQPSLAVEMEGPKLRFVDRKATYMIKVQNPGPTAIENVQLLEQIPDGFRFVEASSGGSFDRSARQVAWFVGRLEANETATVGVQLIASEAGDHRLSAAAKADYGVIGEAETVTRVKGAPHVTIDVTEDDDPVEVDGETVYHIRLSNQGSTPAQRVQFAAEVPKQMQVIDIQGPAEGAIKGQQVVFPPVNVLEAGQSVTYDVHVKCREAGQVRFRAFFRSQDTPSAVLEEETTRIYAE